MGFLYTAAVALIFMLAEAGSARAQEGWAPSAEVFDYRDVKARGKPRPDTLIGQSRVYVASEKETLLDIARRHHLGYLEIVRANPERDPWLPGAG